MYRGFLYMFFCCVVSVFCYGQAAPGWKAVPQILAKIKPPVFSDRSYNVADFGAVGDGKTDCLRSFSEAINKCNQEGGGRVIVPSGVFFIKGPIHLKSNVNLTITQEATLLFSPDAEDYLPVVLTRWEGTECMNYSPLIYGYGLTNVALTGGGKIIGNGAAGFSPWKKIQSPDQNLLRKMGDEGIPVNKRVFGKGHYLRPSMIQFYNCKNVLLDDLDILDSPFWVVHPVLCNNVTVRNLRINSANTNNDGCDPECSVNVLIEKCVFNVGDDAIAIKAGRDADAWRINRHTENIVIRNCVMNAKANGLCIGSEMSGGVRNIYMEDCNIGKVESAIYFKSNLDRGGFVEDVWVRRINVEEASLRLVAFETNYHGYRGTMHPPRFKGFTITDVQCKNGGKYAIFGEGIAGSLLENILLKNINVDTAVTPYHILFARNFILENVKVSGKTLDRVPVLSNDAVAPLD